uniref:Uncharacterized protein n=1 Tax=Salix viminalis TaxID=40686 RepID=A0A6N2N4G6_SALVM
MLASPLSAMRSSRVISASVTSSSQATSTPSPLFTKALFFLFRPIDSSHSRRRISQTSSSTTVKDFPAAAQPSSFQHRQLIQP